MHAGAAPVVAVAGGVLQLVERQMCLQRAQAGPVVVERGDFVLAGRQDGPDPPVVVMPTTHFEGFRTVIIRLGWARDESGLMRRLGDDDVMTTARMSLLLLPLTCHTGSRAEELGEPSCYTL